MHLNIRVREKKQCHGNIAKEGKKRAHLTGHHTGALTQEASMEREDQYFEEKGNEVNELHHQREMEHLGVLPVKADLTLAGGGKF